MKGIIRWVPTVAAGFCAFFTGDILVGVLFGLVALLLLKALEEQPKCE